MKMVKLALFCPNCGAVGLWQDASDPGDYYEGTPMWCFVCARELSDIIVRDPYDKRQGTIGMMYAATRYENHRDAVG